MEFLPATNRRVTLPPPPPPPPADKDSARRRVPRAYDPQLILLGPSFPPPSPPSPREVSGREGLATAAGSNEGLSPSEVAEEEEVVEEG